MTLPAKVNLDAAFARIGDHWNPRIAGEVNDTQVKLVKLKGSFDWHAHATEDELFLVVSGTLLIRFRDGEVRLEPGELVVVPRGVEHQPVAEAECAVMLVEPATTLNTGNVRTARTRDVLERIA